MSENPTPTDEGSPFARAAASMPESMAFSGAASLGLISQTAINIAIQLDQLRSVYGEECFAFVVAELRTSANPRIENVIYDAAERWLEAHPRVVLDLDFVS